MEATQQRIDRRIDLEKNHFFCAANLFGKSVSADVQHSRLFDCGKLFGQQRSGSSQFFGKFDLFADRLF